MRTALVAVLLLTAGLAGCLQDGQDDDRLEIQPGDFVRVHYVGRFASNGTVFESTVDGAYPEGQELSEIPFEDHLEAQFWVYTWHPSTVENRTGRNLTTNVRFRDVNADGFRESMFRTTADVAREGGNLTHRNRNISYYDVPLSVIGDPNVAVQGFYEALLGRSAGDSIEDLEVPPEKGYGKEDPERVRSIDRVLADRSRNLTNRSRSTVEAQSNLSEDTEEGDVIGYDLFNRTRVDARVTNLTSSQVDLHLLLTEGQTLRIPDLWDATVVNLNATSYDLRQDPEVDATYRYTFQQGEGPTPFDVVGLNATHITLDFNDPRAGETLEYDIEILDVVRPDLSELFRGPTVDPFRAEDDRIRDVAMLTSSNILVGTGTGLFLTLNGGERWFPFTFDTLGVAVDAVATGTDRPGELWASVDGRLWHTNNTGFNWSVRSPDASPVVAVAQARTDGSTLYAVVEDDGIHRSDDRGRTWSRVSEKITRAGGIAAGPSDASTLWAATGTGLRRSTDGGQTWSVHAFAGSDVADVDIVDDHTLYATVDGNFTVSVDGGETWETRGGGDRDLTRFAFARDERGRLVATNETSALLLGFNGGRLWPTIS